MGKEKRVDLKMLREIKWISCRESINSNNSSVKILGTKKCSPAFRANNLEILLNNPAPNGSMWKVGKLAIDLRGINYDSPFVLTMDPMVIDTRVCDLRVPTLGTMEWFHFRAREIQFISGKPQQCQAGLMLQNARILDERGNIDEDINGHWNFNNMTMIKDFVSQGLDLQAIQKYSRLSVESASFLVRLKSDAKDKKHDKNATTFTRDIKVQAIGRDGLSKKLSLVLGRCQVNPQLKVPIRGNVIAIVVGVMKIIPGLCSKDTYLVNLSLAHILELAVEAVMVVIRSPLALTDTSNKIKKGTKQDVVMWGPTFRIAVPTILDRDDVQKRVEAKGGLSNKLFEIAYGHRFAAIEGS
eukprot:Gb_33469 [translate_table: standard]